MHLEKSRQVGLISSIWHLGGDNIEIFVSSPNFRWSEEQQHHHELLARGQVRPPRPGAGHRAGGGGRRGPEATTVMMWCHLQLVKYISSEIITCDM